MGQTKAGCGGRPRWMSAVIDMRISSLPRPGRNHLTANAAPLSLATWTTPWPPSPIRFSTASSAPARSIRSVSPGWISPSTSAALFRLPGGTGQQQRDRGVVSAALGGGAALRPARYLPPEPATVVAGGELGQVPAHAGLPRLVGLGVAVSVGGQQQRRQRHLAQVVRAGPERRQRVRLAQAGRPPPVEPVIARHRDEGTAIGAHGEHVAVADLRAHQPSGGDHGDEQGGAVGDHGRVGREVEDEPLLRRVGPHLELIGDRGAPVSHHGPGQPLPGQRGLLVSGGVRGQPGGRVGRHPAGDADGQRGPVGAAEMADVAVPVGDRDDDTAGPVLAGHRVLVGQAAGPVGRSPGAAGDHLPGGDLVRGAVCGHGGQTIVSWSKMFGGTSPGAPNSRRATAPRSAPTSDILDTASDAATRRSAMSSLLSATSTGTPGSPMNRSSAADLASRPIAMASRSAPWPAGWAIRADKPASNPPGGSVASPSVISSMAGRSARRSMRPGASACAASANAAPMLVSPLGTGCSGFQASWATGRGSPMCHHGSVANAITRMNTWACSWSRSQTVRWGSMSAIAKFSAWIFSPFIPPEQSARMMKCSGRREMPPPGICGYGVAWANPAPSSVVPALSGAGTRSQRESGLFMTPTGSGRS